MTAKTIETRLALLEDKEAIRDVLYRYCRAVDRGDPDLMRSCYHPDAVDDHGFFSGLAYDFVDYVLPQLDKLLCSVHSLSNPVIQVDGNYANVETQWSVIHRIGGAASIRDMWHQGRYLDIFEKRDKEWRILKRISILDCERWVRTADLRRLSPEKEHARSRNGRRGPEDPSYRFADHNYLPLTPTAGPPDLWKPLRLVLGIPIAPLHWIGRILRR